MFTHNSTFLNSNLYSVCDPLLKCIWIIKFTKQVLKTLWNKNTDASLNCCSFITQIKMIPSFTTVSCGKTPHVRRCLDLYPTLSGILKQGNRFHYTLHSFPPSSAYMRQWSGPKLVQVMACRMFDAKPLPEPMLPYCRLDPWEQTSVEFESKYKNFSFTKMRPKYHLRNGGYVVKAELR